MNKKKLTNTVRKITIAGFVGMLGIEVFLFTGCEKKETEQTQEACEVTQHNQEESVARGVITEPYQYEDTGYAYADQTTQVPSDLIEKKNTIDYGRMDDRISYYSSTIGEWKECGVLLPAGYRTEKEYPVVYVLHGNGGDHYDWNRDDSYL